MWWHTVTRGGGWRGNWRMEWVASTLHITSEHGVSSTTTVVAHTSAVSSRLNWRPRRFKWTRPFRRKTNSDLCSFAITFQLASTYLLTFSWEANRFSASQEIPRILCNSKVHYRIHKSPPSVPILSQLDPVHIPTSHFLKIHLNIILPSTPGSPEWLSVK